MSWKHVKLPSGVATEAVKPNDADFAARRLLSGLGLRESGVGSAENTAFGCVFAEEGLWARAVRLWSADSELLPPRKMLLCTASQTPLSPGFWGNPDPGWKTKIYAFRDGPACLAVFAMNPENVSALKPPFGALAEKDGAWIIKMELEDFVRCSGGYQI